MKTKQIPWPVIITGIIMLFITCAGIMAQDKPKPVAPATVNVRIDSLQARRATYITQLQAEQKDVEQLERVLTEKRDNIKILGAAIQTINMVLSDSTMQLPKPKKD